METMVWNVLWLAAVAAAAALAGFCMGRLSMQQGEAALEEEEGELAGAGQGAGKSGNTGQWNAQTPDSGPEPGSESPWIRLADRLSPGTVSGKDIKARVSVRSTLAGMGVRPIGAGGLRPEVSGTQSAGMESTRRSVNSRRLRTGRLVHGGREQQEPKGVGRTVGSPVTGLVVSYREGEHPAVLLSPLEDKLYAPANGKIVKLFPMGNTFLFRTEFGTELRIQAGDAKDDLLGRYFRPRVVQNEIVSKGKLLLEFDRLGLKAEGVSFAVTVSVENRNYGSSVSMTAREQVRPGEEIMRVQEKYFPEKNFIEM